LFAFSGLVLSAARRDLQRAPSDAGQSGQFAPGGRIGDTGGVDGAGNPSLAGKNARKGRDELSAPFERYLTGDFRVEDDCGAARAATGGGVEETRQDVFPR
jgi:hypothetical protein